MNLATLSATASLLATSALADVETRAFSFENEGATLSGTLYLPEGHDGTALPTVVVTGAWTTVEEQMPATYAQQMVQRGFAAVSFDFRGWGKSGDLPQNVRFVESPTAKTSDIEAAFGMIGDLAEVDARNIFGLGICASAGYMVDAVSNTPSVKAIGLVAPWLQNEEIVNAVYGGAEGVQELIEMGRAGGIIPAAGPAGTEGVLMPFDGYYSDPALGAIPAYDNQWNNAGWEGWLTYHPADNAERLNQPLAIVHSESAAIPQGVSTFLNGFLGDATLQMLEGVTQFDFYHNDEDVTRAADAMAAHFRANMTTGDDL
ncbi:hypothetical protein JANAI62_36690 [Jannaschia pagri]|uniref:Serine aminopeptidase S33 domain-containing protein n=1 Tax=Jannaschia pagri TaxID=2829797 RepID=A0ABQ4NRN2_9RHOB|nr:MULTISPECIES: alpha/beta hydrolase [unclassified Jannaschia]GIT93187.1 hypothetical protein JANAI61_36450 [Jannaschia sp. AI_61]GIT97046.1 hypothetical protein JANAI62_36690 [Jannaschia sp. AI_62]